MSVKEFKREAIAERVADGWVTLSTETPIKQDGLILKSKNWDLSRGDKVAIKGFYDHGFHGGVATPIVKWPELRIKGKKLQGKPVFASDEDPGFAGKIQRLWDGGFLDDVSVSFSADLSDAREIEVDGYTYFVPKSQTLREASIVGIGADQNAGKGRSEFISRLDRAVEAEVLTKEEREELVLVLGDEEDSTEEVREAEQEIKSAINKFLEGAPERKERMMQLMAESVLEPTKYITLRYTAEGSEVVFKDIHPIEELEVEELKTEIKELRSALDTLRGDIDRLKNSEEGPDSGFYIEVDKQSGEEGLTAEEVRAAVSEALEKADQKERDVIGSAVAKAVDHATGRISE